MVFGPSGWLEEPLWDAHMSLVARGDLTSSSSPPPHPSERLCWDDGDMGPPAGSLGEWLGAGASLGAGGCWGR